MKKILLSSLTYLLFFAANAQQNEFNYSKANMNGAFVGVVTHVNEKVIYAIDLTQLASKDARASFIEKVHASQTVFPISIPDQDDMLIIAGYESVTTEAQAKELLLQFKAQSENGPAPSQEVKSKFSTN